MGGVLNAVNLDIYHYAGNNPVKLVDPDGRTVIAVSLIEVNVTAILGARYQSGVAVDSNYNVYSYSILNLTIGANIGIGANAIVSNAPTCDDFFKSQYITLEGGVSIFSGEIGTANSPRGADYLGGIGIGKSFLDKIIKSIKVGGNFNFLANSTSGNPFGNKMYSKINDPKTVLKILHKMKDQGASHKIINDAIKFWENKLNTKKK